MSTLTRLLLSSLVVLFSFQYGVAQTGLTVSLDSLLKLNAPRAFSGVVLVVQDGKTVYARASGFANRALKTRLSIDNRFLTLSMAKQVTAVLVLQEVQKGHLQLNTPIRKYLPAELTESWADTITLHQLLNHTSGIVHLKQPLAFKPGEHFAYSNLGYDLLAKIAARSARITYIAQAKALFSRCGMSHSSIAAFSKKGLFVNGYAEQESGAFTPVGVFLQGLLQPAAGLVTTAGDLVRWNEALHGGKILPDSLYALMITASSHREHPITGETGYGYGLMTNHNEGIAETGHTGYVGPQGFTAVNLYYPAAKTSIVVLENTAVSDTHFSQAYFFEKQVRDMIRQRLLLAK